jgi:hypothetical protein
VGPQERMAVQHLASFFIVTVFVPALLVTHVLIFRVLVRRQTAIEPDRSRGLEHIQRSGGPGGEPHRSAQSAVAIGS